MRTSLVPKGSALAVATVAALLLAGCGAADPGSGAAESGSGDDHAEGAGRAPAEEVDGPQPRIVATYDGGILTLDAESLEVIEDTTLEGFNRLTSVGDGRHLFVSVGDGFRLFDAGVWTKEHGDHGHSYAAAPTLTDTVYAADTPGHVVAHAGSTVLFGDGDGSIQVFDTDAFGAEQPPQPSVSQVEEPHHGVAVKLDSGEILHTIGTEEERSGAKVVDAEGHEVARSENCPGVHGEAAAKNEVIAVGCEDGILFYSDGRFTKVDAPDDYGRIGNQAGHDDSAVVLGDYKVDRDAELERPHRVSLTDTESGELSLVDLDSSYSFRSLGRGPDGEALVLGTHGKLIVIDPDTGEVTASHPVIEPWEEPTEWQQPRPTLFVQGETAYVSEPATRLLHALDLDSGEVVRTAQLPHATNEVSGVTG